MLTREGTHKSEGDKSRQLIVLWCIADHLVSLFGCRQPFRFLLNNSASELYDHFTSHLKWASLESRPHELEHEVEPASSTSSPGVLDEQQLFLPGSGITKKLYSLRYSMLTSLTLPNNNYYNTLPQLFKQHKNDCAYRLLFPRRQHPRCCFTNRASGSMGFSDTTLG